MILRHCGPRELEWYINDCIEMKKPFPNIIAGFDLVGDENILRPIKDYLPQLLLRRSASLTRTSRTPSYPLHISCGRNPW
ncbi:hypothetical protein DFH29DRAFT_887836 [Suillus ampliporus]|nr:hypothetical protein DFH29DRAFT_887836 [Suillus ampliporus]